MESKKTKRIKIGIVLPYLKSRGPEKQSLNLCKGLQEQGFKVILFNVQGWGYFYDIFRESGIEVVNVGPPVFEGKKRISKNRVFRLAYLARKYRCNLLLSRHGITGQVCAFAAKINLIPSIIVFSNKIIRRGTVSKKSFFKKRLKLLRFLFKRGFADYFVTVSLESAQNLLSSFPALSDRIIPIQNGIDIKEIYNIPEPVPGVKKTGRFRLCFAGSIEIARKGMDTLIETLYELIYRERKKDIELLLVGSGEDEAAVKQLIKEKKLEEYVIYKGEQKNPYPFIKSSDLFILPSRREGFPNALLEAMALGVCCIAFDCDTGPREIIDNNKNGILLPPDDRDKLVDAIIRLKDDPVLRERLSSNGKETIRTKFTYQKMIQSYTKLIKKALKV